MSEINVMLDLETLARTADAAIIQIAAVSFDPITGEEVDLFNAFVADTHNRHVDPQTVAWWMQQSAAKEIGQQVELNGQFLFDVLADFVRWYKKQSATAVWCHGATFDVPIMNHALNQHGLPQPWGYRDTRDTRTLYSIAPGGMPKVLRDPKHTHDARYDCRVQIQQVVGALAALRGACPPNS